ncbi:MAG: hypothetical protein II949_14575 [Prevotella sp.]|nr:hypothetical protein [Prevotella sp.]
MNRNWKSKALIALMMTVAVSMSTSCNMIDEDLDDCEIDFRAQYRMCLVTNENREIARVLGEHTSIADDLRTHLKDVFTDYGRDIALSFYALPDSVATLPLRDQLPTAMNATERSFDIFMPIYDYMHLAVVNVQPNGPVAQRNTDRCHGSQLALTASKATVQEPGSLDDAVASQQSGLFTGRKLLTGLTYGPQQYDFPMYMANSAAAIVLDPRTAKFTDVRIFTAGFAHAFNVCDSAYTYGADYLVRSDRVTLNNTNWLAFCGVSLPSREPSHYTRSRVDIDEPVFLYDDCGVVIWCYDCYVTMATGTVTRTTLGIRHPLRAGQLKIILGWIDDNGVIRTKDDELSVSTDLDWQDGLIFKQ